MRKAAGIAAFIYASGNAGRLLLAPVCVGAVAHADEGGDEDSKCCKGSGECVVHGVAPIFCACSRGVGEIGAGPKCGS